MKLKSKLNNIGKKLNDRYNEAMNYPAVPIKDRVIASVLFLFIGISIWCLYTNSIIEFDFLKILLINLGSWAVSLILLVWLINIRPETESRKKFLKVVTLVYLVIPAILSIIPVGILSLVSFLKTFSKQKVFKRIISYIILFSFVAVLRLCVGYLKETTLNTSVNINDLSAVISIITIVLELLSVLMFFVLLFYIVYKELSNHRMKYDELTFLLKWESINRSVLNEIKHDSRNLTLYCLKNGFDYSEKKENDLAIKDMSDVLKDFISNNNENKKYIFKYSDEIILIIDKNNQKKLESIIEDNNTKKAFCFEYECAELTKNDDIKKQLSNSLANARFNLNFKNEIKISKIAEWGNILRGSLNNISDFIFYLQPKVDLNDVIVGAEALVRWKPTNENIYQFINDNTEDKKSISVGDPISPMYFVEFYEHFNLIHLIDLQVLRAVVDYQNKSGCKVPISVNISRTDFFNNSFVSEVIEIMRKLNRSESGECLVEFEITEGSAPLTSGAQKNFITKVNYLKEALKKECNIDAIFLLDDFGTGCSSIKSINDLCIDTIKFDGSFFSSYDMFKEEIKYITQLCIAKKKKIVAEGVENKDPSKYEAMLKDLSKLNCTMIQGYGNGKGKPVPKDVFLEYLKNPISILY